MNRKLATSIIVIFVALIQTAFFSAIFKSGIVPDLVLAIVIFWVARYGKNRTLPWIVFFGLALDLLLFEKIGTNVLTYLIVALAISALAKRFLVSQKVPRTLFILFLVVLGTLMQKILMAAFLHPFDLAEYFKGAGWSYVIQGKIIFQILLNLAGTMIVIFPIAKLEKYTVFYSREVSLKR